MWTRQINRQPLRIVIAVVIASTAGAVAAETECTFSEHVVAAGSPLNFEVTEGRLLAAWAGEILRPVDTTLTAPDEGTSLLAVATIDEDGIRSEICWHQITVDRTPPEVQWAFDPDPTEGADGSLWLAPGGVLSAEASDLLSGDPSIELRVGAQILATRESTLQHALSTAGSVDWSLRVEDRVGNEVVHKVQPVYVDSVDPTLEWVWRGFAERRSQGWIVGPKTTLTARAVDEDSGLAEREPTANDPPWSFADGPSETTHEISAMDRVGNQASLQTGPILIDRTAPKIGHTILDEWIEGEDGERFHAEPVSISLDVVDDLSGVERVEIQTPGGSWVASANPVEGRSENLSVRATDRAGNQVTQQIGWRTDTTPPQVRMLCNEKEVELETTIVIGSTCFIEVDDLEESGVASWSWTRTGVNVPYSIPQVRLPRRGRFHIVGTATDQMGNETIKDWVLIVQKP